VEKRTRVYPSPKPSGNLLSRAVLILTALIVLSGIWSGTRTGHLAIDAVPSQTPVPLDEAFDETMIEAQIELPSSSWFALQLGAFDNEDAAFETAQQYAKRGAAGYVWHDGRYRALAAVYPSRDDAQLVRQQLETQHAVDTYLYPIELSPLKLKIKGMRGQLEILEAAFLHAGDLIAGLQELSITMDRREMNVQEVAERLESLKAQTSLVALRLRQRFTSPRHSTVEALAALFDDYSAFCETLGDHGSAVGMTAAVKHQTFAALHALKQIYDGLSHT